MIKKLLLIIVSILHCNYLSAQRENVVCDSVKIYFRQSKIDLVPSLNNNKAALDRIVDSLSTSYADSVYKLQKVLVVGGASPEGSVKFNKWLSEKRAGVLFDYISHYSPLPDSLMTTHFLGRDWNGREETLALLREIAWNVANGVTTDGDPLDRLKKFHYGEPYYYMYQNLFPELRASRMFLWYRKIKNPLALLSVPEFPFVKPYEKPFSPSKRTPSPLPKKPFYMDIRTNMLYDALLVPNLGAEFYLGKNWSVVGNWKYGWWKKDRRQWYWRIYGGDIAIRKWFGKAAQKKPLTGHHLGVYGQIFTYDFEDMAGRPFTCFFADALTDKDLLSQQVLAPLQHADTKDGTEAVRTEIRAPEVRTEKELSKLADEVLAGNPVILWEGGKEGIVVGTKKAPLRTIAEPPTDIAIKGPREGFIEDVKTNSALVRKRLKTGELMMDTLTVGRRSQTVVMICYLKGTCRDDIVQAVKDKVEAIDIDTIPDSSYLTRFLSDRPYSLVKQVGTTEKPDIFCAKLAEGRVGLLVDGSPIALTLPYMLVEDFQSGEDYFVPAFRATFMRFLRLFALIVAIYLPAFYVSAQLFKLQLLPVKLLLTIAGSIRDIPLSPSLEMLLVLLVLEVLNEASIRMPKYVGMALSVVGALVLGDTAVKAGIISTPAVIITAFSAICLYTVPDLVETTATLRLLYLLAAGAVGMYGVAVLSAFLLCYLSGEQSYGVPLLAPFAPLVVSDLKDGISKSNLYSAPPELSERKIPAKSAAENASASDSAGTRVCFSLI